MAAFKYRSSQASRALLLLSLAGSSCCMGQHFVDLAVESAYVDNLTRSERALDAREDASITATVQAGAHFQPGLYTGLTVWGAVSRSQYRRYSGLSNTELDLAMRVSRKFGIGDRAPSLHAELAAGRTEYNRGLRNAWIYRAAVVAQKRVTETLNLSAGVRYERRDADHDVPRVIPAFPRPGNSWDIDTRSFFVAAEQDLGPAMWLSAGYRFQEGDVVSTAVSYPKIFDTATAITLDPLFGPVAVAYRIAAQTHIIAIDINRAVFASATLHAGFEYQQTHGANSIDYESTVLRAGFIHSF